MNVIRVSSFLFLLILVGCSTQSKSDKLSEELETVNSWTATAEMTAKAWMRGTVPETYAKQTLEKARQQLKDEGKTLLKESSQQQPQLQQLEKIMQQMKIAIEQKNKTALARQLQQLDAIRQQLDRLSKPKGKQP